METRLTINKLKAALWPLPTETCISCHRAGIRSKLTRVPHHSVVLEPHKPSDRTVHEEWYCTTCMGQLVRDWTSMRVDMPNANIVRMDLAVEGGDHQVEMEFDNNGMAEVRWDLE